MSTHTPATGPTERSGGTPGLATSAGTTSDR